MLNKLVILIDFNGRCDLNFKGVTIDTAPRYGMFTGDIDYVITASAP